MAWTQADELAFRESAAQAGLAGLLEPRPDANRDVRQQAQRYTGPERRSTFSLAARRKIARP